ncbi:MAG: flagellar motor protein MotB [Desulfobacterales bacterium]|nr:flagellar motor protein MotB [Desulfobacterales bacterium]
MNNKHEDSEDEGKGKWLTTFNDMVTLLLTFLVLVLSLSATDASKMQEISYAMRAVFDTPIPKKEGITIFTPFVLPMINKTMTVENKKKELAERINNAAETIAGVTGDETSAGSKDIMNVKIINEGVSVTLRENLLFKTSMAEIEEKNRPALKLLSSIFQKTDTRIRVEGHTDNVPINTSEFPSNWELSTARAVNVVKYFISEGGILPERLSAAGYADSRPLCQNVNDYNRSINRRVEVILALKKH